MRSEVRRRDVPARLAIACHSPTLVGVDHQHDVRRNSVAHPLHQLDITAPVGVVEAKLDGLDAAVTQCSDAPHAFLGVRRLAARRVREQALRTPAQ
jgi:hypothetical protein